MSQLKFYRGLSTAYNKAIHGNGIYFTTDTNEIKHNGISYGITNADNNYASKEFVLESIKGFVGYSIYQKEDNKIIFLDKQYGTEKFSITLPLATSDNDGLMSIVEKIKLNSIEEGAQVNKIEEINIDLGNVELEGKVANIKINDAVSELINTKNTDISDIKDRVSDLENYDNIIDQKFSDDDNVPGSVRNLAHEEAKELLTWYSAE